MLNDRLANNRESCRGTCQRTELFTTCNGRLKARWTSRSNDSCKLMASISQIPRFSIQSPDTESLSSDQIGRSPQDHTSQTLTYPQMSDLTRGGPPHRSPSWSQQISRYCRPVLGLVSYHRVGALPTILVKVPQIWTSISIHSQQEISRLLRAFDDFWYGLTTGCRITPPLHRTSFPSRCQRTSCSCSEAHI